MTIVYDNEDVISMSKMLRRHGCESNDRNISRLKEDLTAAFQQQLEDELGYLAEQIFEGEND